MTPMKLLPLAILCCPVVAYSQESTPGLSGFKLDGTRWTYQDGQLSMEGVLLKPEGAGPFPAVLISHGMGGSAESFGMSKAREWVQWGWVWRICASAYRTTLSDKESVWRSNTLTSRPS